jgi:hypothetical protein
MGFFSRGFGSGCCKYLWMQGSKSFVCPGGSVTKKKRGPQADWTPWQSTDPSQSISFWGPLIDSRPPWSSLPQTLYRTQVMHTHEYSNIISLRSWNIRYSDRKAQSSHFIYNMYRGCSPSIPSRSSSSQTAHKAWSLGFYSYSDTLSNMVTNANCSCSTGY